MIKEKQNPTYWLEEVPVYKSIIPMVLPMVFGLSAIIIYSLTDTFWLGRLANSNVLAVIALTFPFTTVLMVFGRLLGVGVSTSVG